MDGLAKAPELCVTSSNINGSVPPRGTRQMVSDATRASENIPTRRHRVKTTLEEQSIWLTFFTSFPLGGVQIGGQAECVRAQEMLETPGSSMQQL